MDPWTRTTTCAHFGDLLFQANNRQFRGLLNISSIAVWGAMIEPSGMIRIGPNIVTWVTYFPCLIDRLIGKMSQLITGRKATQKKTYFLEKVANMLMMFFANGKQRLAEEIGEIEVG